MIWALSNQSGSMKYINENHTSFPPTVLCEFGGNVVDLDDEKISLRYVDCPGCERYIPYITLILEKCDMIVFGYDITDKSSFQEIKEFWVKQYYKKNNNKI